MDVDKRFGGIEGRRKGGLESQKRRQLNPEYYASMGCNIAKRVLIPTKTADLSEIIGVILGDGGITDNQLTITLNSEKDLGYNSYLKNKIFKLFGLNVTEFKIKSAKAICLKVSGINFIKALKGFGLYAKNKVRQQVDVPVWIKNNLCYSKWCLRGLIDTDGGVFLNKYTVNNREYSYLKICFTNYSLPLTKFVYKPF